MTNSIPDIFNSAIVAAAVSALDELRLFDELQTKGSVRIEDFCRRSDLHQPSILALLRGVHRAGIIEFAEAGQVALQGEAFQEAFACKGYFLWLVRGYGRMLSNLATIARNSERQAQFIERDGEYIAMSGRDYGARFVDSHFRRLLGQAPFAAAADLGCGAAGRLIDIARERPSFRGIGVEVDGKAVARARRSIQDSGLQARLSVVEDDIRRLKPNPAFDPADVVFSFFMGHDLWPRSDCLDFLECLPERFPHAERFLLADTYRSDLQPSQNFPIFTYGFEMTHAFMGHYIPTLEEWMDLFEASSWTCVHRQELGIPFSCVFDLRRKG